MERQFTNIAIITDVMTLTVENANKFQIINFLLGIYNNNFSLSYLFI